MGLGIAALYGVPLALLWPTRQRVLRPDGLLDRQALCLRLVGAVPLGYLGFGRRRFLAHFLNGNMVYLFMVL